MSTSGSTDFILNRNEILTEAAELINVIGAGESLEPDDIISMTRTLNLMTKQWQSKGIALWKNTEATLFLTSAGESYELGPTGANCTASFAKTEVATAASSGASAVVVDSISDVGDTFDRDGILTSSTPGAGSLTLDGTLVSGETATLPSTRKVLIYSDGDDSGVTFDVTGTDGTLSTQVETITGPNTGTVYSSNNYDTVTSITISGAGTGNIEIGCVGDNVGIELDGGDLQWTNISGSPAAATITLITTLTDDVAVDNHVYTYEDKIPRPLEIPEARLHRGDDSEYPLWAVSRQEYMNLANKTSTGSTSQFYYDPQIPKSKLYVWPTASSTKEYIKMTARLPIEDFDSATDTGDIPVEFLLPLAYNLAVLVAPKFGVEPSTIVIGAALQYKQELEGFDAEEASVFFGVDYR